MHKTMIENRPDQVEREQLKEIQNPRDFKSYERTRLHDVKYAIAHAHRPERQRSVLEKTPAFQTQAQAISGEYGGRIRALLGLQSHLLGDIERHILEEDPLHLEAGRSVLDSNCHQTARLVLGLLNNWGKMQAARMLNSTEDTAPVSQFGIPKSEADLKDFEVIEKAETAFEKWESPLWANFNFTDHSALVLKPDGLDFLCFEQAGHRGPLRFKSLSAIEDRWGPALFIKPRS